MASVESGSAEAKCAVCKSSQHIKHFAIYHADVSRFCPHLIVWVNAIYCRGRSPVLAIGAVCVRSDVCGGCYVELCAYTVGCCLKDQAHQANRN